MICNHCRRIVPDEAKFCPFCGENLSTYTQPSIPEVEINQNSEGSKSSKASIFVYLILMVLFIIGIIYTTIGASPQITVQAAQERELNLQPETFDTNLLYGTWVFDDAVEDWDEYYYFQSDGTYIKSQICPAESGNLLMSKDVGTFLISGDTLQMYTQSGTVVAYTIKNIDSTSIDLSYGFMHSLNGQKISQEIYNKTINSLR